jgi:hypothetical protein
MTEDGIKAIEARHSKERAFFPRVSKSDPIVKWMQFPPHSVLLEVPHLGTGYDGSRFCYVLAVKETEDDEDVEDDEAGEVSMEATRQGTMETTRQGTMEATRQGSIEPMGALEKK